MSQEGLDHYCLWLLPGSQHLDHWGLWHLQHKNSHSIKASSCPAGQASSFFSIPVPTFWQGLKSPQALFASQMPASSHALQARLISWLMPLRFLKGVGPWLPDMGPSCLNPWLQVLFQLFSSPLTWVTGLGSPVEMPLIALMCGRATT